MSRILIVDDSALERDILAQVLKKKIDAVVLHAEDAENCLRILETEEVDLILLDIMLPDLSGEQLLQKIRSTRNPIELPIIMLSSKKDSTDVVSCLQMGANDYITKPANFAVAISRINTHLALTTTSREMARLKELSALNAMITTYNHEINNPLTIAMMLTNDSLLNDPQGISKLKDAHQRIATIVKKIRAITEKNEVKIEGYASSTKMVKID